MIFFFFQAEDGIRDLTVTGVQTCALPISPGGRMVIIGGGYIGLEVAASARGLGLEVTVLEMAARVMSRVTCAEISAFYEAEHARQGVRIHCNETLRALHGDARSGRVRAVLTEAGREYPADIVIIGCGVVPADELARAAGLSWENGVVTDVHCRDRKSTRLNSSHS